MRTLTKNGLASQLSKACKDMGMTHRMARTIIERMIDLVVSHFQAGGKKFTLVGFGTIVMQMRRAFRIHNPKTKQTFAIPAKRVFVFRTGSDASRRINDFYGGE